MTAPALQSWQSVQAEVMRRINERVWLPGAIIPNEAELAAEFGCARATVNRALRDLAEKGLLDRRRKAGTRVTVNPVRKAILDIPITRHEVERRGAVYRHALIEQQRTSPPPVVAGWLNLAPDTEMLHQRALHLADSQPFLYEDRWINIAEAPQILDVDFDTISANEWLVQNVGFTKGDLTLSAANADPVEAELLATQEGAALFVVDRTTWNGAAPITQVRLAYAPGFRMQTTI